MRYTRIYSGQGLKVGAVLRLDPEPSRHVARALRMRPGDKLVLFNGDGNESLATITAVQPHSVEARVDQQRPGQPESPLAIHLGIAVSRGDRMDWVVQKATELGVASISPLLTAYTGVKLPPERAEKKLRHWQQVVVSACEQSGRCQLPTVRMPQPLVRWLSAVRTERKIMLHPRGSTNTWTEGSPDSVALLIGPEGGLSEEDVNIAGKAGFESVQLGPRILRTETAPLAAIAILQARWGDLKC